MNKSSEPSWIVQLPLVPSTELPSDFASLDKFKSPVYMLAQTLDDEPRSYVSVVEGIKLPVISCELISNAPPNCGVVSFTISNETELSNQLTVFAEWSKVASYISSAPS